MPKVFRITELIEGKATSEGRKAYTPYEVAKLTGIHFNTVTRYMRGVATTISPNVARAFARFLDVRPYQLFDTGAWE